MIQENLIIICDDVSMTFGIGIHMVEEKNFNQILYSKYSKKKNFYFKKIFMIFVFLIAFSCANGSVSEEQMTKETVEEMNKLSNDVKPIWSSVLDYTKFFYTNKIQAERNIDPISKLSDYVAQYEEFKSQYVEGKKTEEQLKKFYEDVPQIPIKVGSEIMKFCLNNGNFGEGGGNGDISFIKSKVIKRIKLDGSKNTIFNVKRETILAMSAYWFNRDLFPRTYGYFFATNDKEISYAFIIMEKHGQDLLKSSEQPTIDILENFVEDVITSLKNLNIIHYDIKPGNILYDGKKLVLTDFGAARLQKFNEELAKCPNVNGTAPYVPPVLIGLTIGSTSTYETKIDVTKHFDDILYHIKFHDEYSLGMLLLNYKYPALFDVMHKNEEIILRKYAPNNKAANSTIFKKYVENLEKGKNNLEKKIEEDTHWYIQHVLKVQEESFLLLTEYL